MKALPFCKRQVLYQYYFPTSLTIRKNQTSARKNATKEQISEKKDLLEFIISEIEMSEDGYLDEKYKRRSEQYPDINLKA